jgi:uroporphyrin-III C-methyltransferase / precorrin-2 dehydrogenase / sirohydrochlorin ferrochelatase
MRFLPVFFDLSAGHVVLIGSGAQAIAKLHLLRASGANVRWYAQHPDVAEELVAASHYAGRIEIAIGEPAAADLTGALAIVCAGGRDLDERIAALARSLSVPVNVVDRPDLSTFIPPSSIAAT